MTYLVQNLTSSDSALNGTLGEVSWVGDKAYRLVQFKDAVAYAAGQCVTWKDKDGFTVTNDISGSEGEKEVAGIVLFVAVENEYGYIQCAGQYATAKKAAADDNMVTGDILNAHASTDGVLATYNPAIAGAPTDAELFVLGRGHCVAAGASDDPNDTVPVTIVNCV